MSFSVTDVVSKNKFFAGPTAGIDRLPSFRAITPLDLPVVPISKGGLGKTSIAASRLLWSTATDTLGEIALGYGMTVASSELRTPQDLRTSGTPQFTRLGVGVSAHATIPFMIGSGDAAFNSDRTNICEGSGYFITVNAGTALTGITGGPNRANIELGTDKPDGNSLQGSVRFFAGLNTTRSSGCNIGTIDCETVGSTANDRGGLMSFWTKKDGGTEAECFYVDQLQRATFLQNLIVNAPTSGKAITASGASGQFVAQLLGNASTSNSWGCYIQAGTNTSDYALYIVDAPGTTLLATLRGDGLFSTAGQINAGTSIATAAPSGGTAKAWKLGNRASVSPTLPNRTIEVEVDGVTLYVHAKTTND